MEEELWHYNMVIPYVPLPATHRHLQRCCRLNHRICRHFLRLIARFAAACPLGISSPLNLRCRWSLDLERSPSPASPQDWLPMDQHRTKTRPHSAPVSRIRSPSTAQAGGSHTAAPDLLQRALYFHKSYKGVEGTRTAGLRQHPPVQGRQSRLLHGLHGGGTALGEEHGLCVATPQHMVLN
jgi:hypothetical protein